MLRLLFTACIAGACAFAIPAMIQSNPDVFERNLAAGVDSARRIVTVRERDEVRVRKPKSLPGRKVRLAMNRHGHFVSDFMLNGRRVSALVDTGATLVAINATTARRIGLKIKPRDFKYEVRTANGKTKAASAMIKSVKIGRINVKNVQAAIMQDAALDGTLIGMSFLKRLRSFRIENQSLLLKQ